MKNIPFFLIQLFFVLFLQTAHSMEQTHWDYSEFSKQIILDQGRKKPLDTYAHSVLLQFSGKSSYQGTPAIAWLAKLFFTPDSTRSDKVFLVNSMEVIQAMGLSLETARRFGFSELEPGLNQLQNLAMQASEVDEKKRTLVQNGLIQLYHNINLYFSLSASFQFSIPHKLFTIHNQALAQKLELAAQPTANAFYPVFAKSATLHHILMQSQDSLLAGDSAVVAEASRLSGEMMEMSKYYSNIPITMIPANIKGLETWLSPWDFIITFTSDTTIKAETEHLYQLAVSYQKSDEASFKTHAKELGNKIASRMGTIVSPAKISAEVFYNNAKLFFWSKFLYIIALLSILASFVLMRKAMVSIAWIAISTGLLLHTIGVLSRMYIMGRPPVTNLYETFVFVAWMSVFITVFVEYIQRKGLGLLIASFSGFCLLMIAEKYALDGDTLGMLVAVLDSNFWLATHVITISMGYAGCCAAGVAGHIYMVQKACNASIEKQNESYKITYGIMAFGLIFAFIGTVLGGIWADQSWGRFWGWDPKENGALMIVLWCSILFHSKLGKTIGELGFAAGAVIGTIIVMFAWFGVNLLGVGLHSYGFSSGIFFKFFLYIGIEVLFLIATLGWIYKNHLIKKTA